MHGSKFPANLETRTLSERIFAIVRDRIIAGRIEAGSAIRQDALAHEFGCSKVPLREALAGLKQEGLLISRANRGYFVRPLSVREAEDIFALRMKIEPDAVREAARKAVAEDHDHARSILASFERSVGRDPDAVRRLNRDFHMALVRPAARRVSAETIERLHIMSECYVGKHLEPSGRDNRALKEHQMILAAWMSGDGQLAGDLIHRHIELTLDDLREQFERPS